MARRHPLRLPLTAPVMALIALAGCTSATTDATPEPGPVTAILDTLWSNQDDLSSSWATDLENSIARCMTAQGFEYVPSTEGYVVVSGTAAPESPTEDWVRVNGYGISTEGLSVPALDDTEAPAQEITDPNADYVASLSPTEHASYQAALFGAPSTASASEDDADDEYRWEDNGCTGAAQHELTAGMEALQSSSLFIDFNKATDALDESVLTAPATVEASAAWADCMADAGYPGLPTPADSRAAIAAAWEKEYAPSADFPGAFNGPTSANAAKFRATEIATALADLTCNQEVGLATTLHAVRVELEEAFIKDHQAELDEYVAAVTEAQR